MTRDLEKESTKIRNGNRYVLDSSGKGVFARDTDRLFIEYTNLRKKIYNRHKDSFSDYATKAELRSYIDEQFIKLVKEYEINSPVDFPGYIKKKLPLRVRESFMHGKFKDKGREILTKEDSDIEEMLESVEIYNELTLEDIDLRDFVFATGDFSDMEVDVINLWLEEKLTDAAIVRKLVAEYKCNKREVERTMEELRIYVKNKITAYNKD